MDNGWTESASGWIEALGEHGDWSREFVLDPAMLARVSLRRFHRALDVGCGEGRFCRALRSRDIAAIGIDPTAPLIEEARRRDPCGDYRIGIAEKLPFNSASFDLVVSYLSLIDIGGFRDAIDEMARVLEPGGALLIANLSSFVSANPDQRWLKDETGRKVTFRVDNYLTEHSVWAAWGRIRIRNWHRPLSAYMRALLETGLELVFFDEPPAIGADQSSTHEQHRVPQFVVMEWRKPTAR